MTKKINEGRNEQTEGNLMENNNINDNRSNFNTENIINSLKGLFDSLNIHFYIAGANHKYNESWITEDMIKTTGFPKEK